jgi:ribosomal protein L40E
LSSPKVDREIIKYLIFHELLHENGYWAHDDEFRKREWQYPNSAELDGMLDSLHLEYNMDNFWKDSVYFEEPEFIVNTPQNESENNYNKKAEGVVEGYKYCRNCGNRLPENSKFCDKCGSKLDY